MLTTFSADEDVARAPGAGASGFLLKDTAPDELIHSVRLIAAGGDRAVGAKDHVSAILGKLGVENRVQAAVLAHRAGLTRTDPRPAA